MASRFSLSALAERQRPSAHRPTYLLTFNITTVLM